MQALDLKRMYLTIMKKSNSEKISIPVVIFTFGFIIISGFLIGHYSVQHVEENAQKSFITQTQIAALTIDSNKITDLSGSQSDLTKNSYKYVREKLKNIKDTSNNIRFVYLMINTKGGVRFLVDAEPDSSKDYSPPG